MVIKKIILAILAWENGVFTIIDAPGHRDFIKNMITGNSESSDLFIVKVLEKVKTCSMPVPNISFLRRFFELPSDHVGH